jgi:hypothetical protein
MLITLAGLILKEYLAMLGMMKTRRVSKSTCGVKFDPFMSLQSLSRIVGVDGVTPAWFYLQLKDNMGGGI